MPPTTPKNAYTYTPEQHSNLFLGTMQLLIWLVFRPMAWRYHLQRIGPVQFNQNFLLQPFSQYFWGPLTTWRFKLQCFVFIPSLISLMVGIILFGLGIPLPYATLSGALGIAFGIALGATESIALEVAEGIALGVAFGLAFSVALGIVLNAVGAAAFGVVTGLALGMALGVALGVLEAMAFGVTLGVTLGLATGLVIVIALGVKGSLYLGAALGIGLTVNWWRPVVMAVLLIPWHFLLYRVDAGKARPEPSLLHCHLACWDEWQRLALWGLDRHLLLVLERAPTEGCAALNYLSTTHQRWAAQMAQIELDARHLELPDHAAAIGQIHRDFTVGELPGPADALFRSFNRISEDVAAALNQTSAYNQRLALNAVGDRLDGLLRELTRSSDRYAVRFRPIAQRWSSIIELELNELARTAELRQEIDSPYIIGVPLTERQEIFVGRTEVTTRIEQLLVDRRRPPLLLYGQRRMGKTSLLNNLGRLLPSHIVPLFVDLQGPVSRASDHTGFLYNLAKAMADSAKRQRNIDFPLVQREFFADDPFTQFDEWLDAVAAILQDQTALLALDEFEVLDQVLSAGQFSETAVLGMLRNLIQHRSRFKVLLSGSHTLEEFQRWSSYLINAQVLHLGYLKASEARQLIEYPVQDFALCYEPAASQRVLELTRGHPFLVQLLCAEVVVLKNEQDPTVRRLATLTDVEAAVAEALQSGSMFFSDIERNQLAPVSLAVMRYIASQGEGAGVELQQLVQVFPEGLKAAIDQLCCRELVELTPQGYGIQVELIRRWFVR